jgi:hypothetical protein
LQDLLGLRGTTEKRQHDVEQEQAKRAHCRSVLCR